MTATYLVTTVTNNNGNNRSTMTKSNTTQPSRSSSSSSSSSSAVVLPPILSPTLPLQLSEEKSTSATTTHHDIIISLTSPALVKKKSVCVNHNVEFESMGGSSYKSVRNYKRLPPASIQLIRNSLLFTNVSETAATASTGSMTCGINTSSKHITTSSQDNAIDTSTASKTTMTTTDATYYYHYHRRQQQQYRKLKRLDTEPIPILRSKNSNDDMRPIDGVTTINNSTKNELISNTIHPSSAQQRRRQIFNSFWTTKPRSNSCCSVDVVQSSSSLTCTTKTPPPPPMPLHIRSKSEGFAYNTNYFDYNTTTGRFLSALPSPMQRMHKSSGGVYPLVQPKSILRKKLRPNDSPEENGNSTSVCVLNDNNNNNKSSDDVSTTISDYDRSSSISSSYNSIHSIPNGNNNSHDTTDNVDTFMNNCSIVTVKPTVHFDPRITITELVGRDHDRIWYTDVELNRFKYETVAVARSYFSKHPDQIVYYNQPFFDPITKTMRKRALFSMPALSNIAITEKDENTNLTTFGTATDIATINQNHGNQVQDSRKLPIGVDNSTEQEHQRHLLSLLAFEDDNTVQCISSNLRSNSTTGHRCGDDSTIRHVLIVDHNRWILDLLVRSVQTMFNFDSGKDKGHFNTNVIVECAPNVQVAMAMMKDIVATLQRRPPFDLIIAEQPPLLSPSQNEEQKSDSVAATARGAAAADDGASKEAKDTDSSLLLTGAELLFHTLPETHRNQMLLISVESSSSSSNKSCKVPKGNLMTTNATATVTTLSDFVWNKPPPRMDNNLRMQLIRTLQKKRGHVTNV